MRPADLKSPFSYRERRILIQDGIFYIPSASKMQNSDFPDGAILAYLGMRPRCT